MAAKAAYVVGQKRFVQTMRKTGADMQELKDVNRQAADIALPAVRQLAARQIGQARRIHSRGRDTEGRCHPRRPQVRALRGRHQLRVAEEGIRPRLFVNQGVAGTEGAWRRVYKQFIDKTMSQIKEHRT